MRALQLWIISASARLHLGKLGFAILALEFLYGHFEPPCPLSRGHFILGSAEGRSPMSIEVLDNTCQTLVPLKLLADNLPHHATGCSDLRGNQAVIDRISLPVRCDHACFPKHSEVL